MENRLTLFLDRDGVINRRMPGEYVKHPDEFIPGPGMPEAMRLLSGLFGRIVVVTNQAGIGKGVMDEPDLDRVHRKMFEIVQAGGGRIDRVYYCPHRPDAGCDCRKPATGMAFQAKADFPDLDFSRAWIVGDSVADMKFGLALGMKTVLITGKAEEAGLLESMEIDYRFGSLLDFARFFANLRFSDGF